MMMNQVEGSGTQDRISLETDQIVDSHLVQTASMASWHTQWENHSLKESGVRVNAGENRSHEVQPIKPVENGTNAASGLSTSSSGAANAPQSYSGYTAYSNTNPYFTSSNEYASYYNQYQQVNPYHQQPNQYQQQPNQYQQPPNQCQQQPNQYQQPSNQCQQQPNQYQPQPNPYQTNQYQQPTNQYPQQTNQYPQQTSQYPQQTTQYQQQHNQYQQQSNPSYSHHVRAHQNTGVAYQPLSSIQNTGSYSGSASYSSTYYNPGDYQTSGSYTSGTYGTQTNPWHESQYAAYSSHQYSTYTPDSIPAYGSSPAVANSQYQQHYKQWDDYYRQTQTEVSCAPGTEHLSVSGMKSSFPAASTGHTASNHQIPAADTPMLGPQSSSAGLTSFQSVAENGSIPDGQQKHVASIPQYDPHNSSQVPPEVRPTLENSQTLQNSSFREGSTASHPTSYQFSQSHQLSYPAFSQPPEPLDSHRASKLQIPTNPKIISNLPFVASKPEKNSLTATAPKPAYISVSLQKPGETDPMLKPGVVPKSLRGYVERALARCKNDRQKIACQDIMKEVITKATADGTLYTRDWDSEPLFPLPDVNGVDKQDTTSQFPLSSTPKNRSPSRRTKSRWEPISEGKVVDKSNNVSYESAKHVGWSAKQFFSGKPGNEYNSGTNVSSTDLKVSTKSAARPAKRQRLLNTFAKSDDETSSDSDNQSLTKYYSTAAALADSPEEKKRRDSRSKRFDKKHGNLIGNSHMKTKVASAGLYARQVADLGLVRITEGSGSRAVEDIDWDAFTVKGTCQDIEKRYLRLTSAPDPTMVRPEEVLEKALTMVQNSQKNYLYKCDQLKSIRQDLTVQHIRNELTVKVYETHARLAIEVGDLPEYNQCQSQLRTLYGEGITGCHMEFAAYNLLCVILHSNNNRDLLSAMSSLSSDAKNDEAVQHALSVRTAVTSGNYVMFFRLYKTAPNLNSLFMDLYVEKMRYAAIKCICRSYRPTVPVSYLSQILGFNNASEANEEQEVECVEWLKSHGALLILENSGETLVDAKASVQSLYMPEPEDAVAHGDVNLAVNDFFTRSLV